MKLVEPNRDDMFTGSVTNTPTDQVLRALGLFFILASMVFGCFILFCIYTDYSTGRPIVSLVTILGLLGISSVTGIGLRSFRKWARMTATLLVALMLTALVVVAVLNGNQDLESSIMIGTCAVVCLFVLWSPSANRLFNAKSNAKESAKPRSEEGES